MLNCVGVALLDSQPLICCRNDGALPTASGKKELWNLPGTDQAIVGRKSLLHQQTVSQLRVYPALPLVTRKPEL